MPIHEYVCHECKWSGDRIVKHAERDNQVCDFKLTLCSAHQEWDESCDVCKNFSFCPAPLYRVEVSMTTPHRTDHRFQMEAILGNGQKLAGSFGRSQRKNKGRF